MNNYNFETLSGNEFEILTRDLLQEEFGFVLESFKSGRDSGIDLRYASGNNNSLIVQCKHYVGSGGKKLISDLRNQEFAKVKKLSPDRYIIVTSVGLSPHDKDEILKIFSPFISLSDILGREDLNNLLARHPKIELNHYKLWLSSINVLESLLKRASINRTQVELERISRKIKYYVQNESYPKAKKILEEQNYCIISGIPGIGKTTLAEALFLDHIGRGFEPVRIYRSIDEGFEMLSQGVSQVFYFDDFLGTTAFDEHSLERNEDKQLLNFLHAMRDSGGTKKLILTSRDYILRQARLSFESIRTTDLKPHLFVIDLHHYTRFNKAEILYNHLYFSDLSTKHISDLIKDKQYLAIIDHPNYSPRVIEWMTQMKNRFPQPEEDFATAFLDALDNPKEIWRYAFDRNLSRQAQYILWVLVSLPDDVKINDIERVFDVFQQHMAKYYGHTIETTDFLDAIEEIEGTFIQIDLLSADVRTIRFHNPSVRDFLESYLSENLIVIKQLVLSAQFFSQLRWLWGKYQIDFRRNKKPTQVKPRYREHLLKISEDFTNGLIRTIYSERPFLNIEIIDDLDDLEDLGVVYETDVKPYSLASRLLLINEANQMMKSARLDEALLSSMSVLSERAKSGKESSFELMRLAKSLKEKPYFFDIKSSFLFSLSSLADFERYLIFKLRYSNVLTADDELYVEERFRSLYPGRDLSYVDQSEDYIYEPEDVSFNYEDDDFEYDIDGSIKGEGFNTLEEQDLEKHRDDLDEVISNLFDGFDS